MIKYRRIRWTAMQHVWQTYTNSVCKSDSTRSLDTSNDNRGVENRPFNSPSTTGLADLSFVGNNLPLGCTRFL
jgi:hypothetical protein